LRTNKLGGTRKGAALFSRRTIVLSKSPTATPNTTFAFSGTSTVRLARNVPCPHCGRHLHASDVEVVPGGINVVCAGCHRDLLIIAEATSTEAAS
jgi:hypothetical protein